MRPCELSGAFSLTPLRLVSENRYFGTTRFSRRSNCHEYVNRDTRQTITKFRTKAYLANHRSPFVASRRALTPPSKIATR